MKIETTKEAFEKIIKAYLDGYGDRKAGEDALADWGVKLCEEQQKKDIAEFFRLIAEAFSLDLPDILTQINQNQIK